MILHRLSRSGAALQLCRHQGKASVALSVSTRSFSPAQTAQTTATRPLSLSVGAALSRSSPSLSSSPYTLCTLRGFHGSALRREEAEEPLENKLRIADLLRGQEDQRFALSEESSVNEAVAFLVNEKRSSALALHSDGTVAGIFTARDLLQFVKDHASSSAARTLSDTLNSVPIKDVMTRADKMVYCSPTDTIAHCREIMFQCKIRNMPVLDKGEIRGILTMKLLADSAFDLLRTGGKKGFMENVSSRRGLPSHVRVCKASKRVLDLEIGSFALPHPFKSAFGVANTHRDYGPSELSTDLSVCEDAFFAVRVRDTVAERDTHDHRSLSQTQTQTQLRSLADTHTDAHTRVSSFSPSLEELEAQERESCEDVFLPLSATARPSQVYLCVADGVGSWRAHNVDPRLYSHALVENAKKAIEEDALHRESVAHGPLGDREPLHPLEVISEAWSRTQLDEVVGSSTVCVATLDGKHSQLSYSNIGDGGLMVVRHIDSTTAGYMRERAHKQTEEQEKSDLKIAYLSQQQMRSFNLPFQLGFTNIPNTPNSFETPSDADTASIPVFAGDVLLLATDGLFDNMDLQEILHEVSLWKKDFFSAAKLGVNNANKTTIEMLSMPASEAPTVLSGAEQALAERLVKRARELSLDKQRDSPFALLAKENDILWGGGMPDDTSVVVARVVAL